MNIPDPDRRLMHASLVITWLATAAISVIEWNGQSRAVLLQAGITGATAQDALIALGIAVDLAVGLALWLKPGRTVYLGALLAKVLGGAQV